MCLKGWLHSPGVLVCIDIYIAGPPPWSAELDSAWDSAFLIYFPGKQSFENHWPREWAICRDSLGGRNGIERNGLEFRRLLEEEKKKLKAVSSEKEILFA